MSLFVQISRIPEIAFSHISQISELLCFLIFLRFLRFIIVLIFLKCLFLRLLIFLGNRSFPFCLRFLIFKFHRCLRFSDFVFSIFFRLFSSHVFPYMHCSDWFVQICVHINCVQMWFFRFVVKCCLFACADIQMFRCRYSDIQTLRYSAYCQSENIVHTSVFELFVLQPFQAQPSSRAECNE